jgi:hypothetical protein
VRFFRVLARAGRRHSNDTLMKYVMLGAALFGAALLFVLNVLGVH